MGEALEYYIKDLFCGSFGVKDIDQVNCTSCKKALQDGITHNLKSKEQREIDDINKEKSKIANSKINLREEMVSYLRFLVTGNYYDIMKTDIMSEFTCDTSHIRIYNEKQLYSYDTAVCFVKAFDKDVVFVFNHSMN